MLTGFGLLATYIRIVSQATEDVTNTPPVKSYGYDILADENRCISSIGQA